MSLVILLSHGLIKYLLSFFIKGWTTSVESISIIENVR